MQTVIRAIVLASCLFASIGIADELNVGVESDQPIAIGEYVIIYADLKDCPLMPRIVDGHKVALRETYLLNLGPIRLAGHTAREIHSWLLDRMAEAREDNSRPNSIRVEVLKTEQEYLMIRDEILTTNKFLARGMKPCKITEPENRETIDPDWYRIANFSHPHLSAAFNYGHFSDC